MKVMKKILICMIFVFSMVSTINAQSNQLAYVKNINTKTYLDVKFKSYHMTHPAENLYDLEWNNNMAHPYKNIELPEEYKINLTDFSMPLDNTLIVTSKFGYRAKFKRNHNGVDLNLHVGDTVYTAFSGKVRVVNYNKGGYGNYIVIRHYNGLETIYGHLSKQLVCVNQYVKSGDPIGLGGNTGRSTGPHLHLETRFLGKAIDPLKIFDFKNQDILADYYTFTNNSSRN